MRALEPGIERRVVPAALDGRRVRRIEREPAPGERAKQQVPGVLEPALDAPCRVTFGASFRSDRVQVGHAGALSRLRSINARAADPS